MSFAVISHAISDVGRVRATNQDSGYAGGNLFFVADGMGGHAGGDIASALVTQRVAQLDVQFNAPDKATEELVQTIWAANARLASAVEDHRELAGMGTTFSGLTVVGNQVVVAHIGDSRIYMVRDGQVEQVTSDHTFVQRLLDTGRITEEEAAVHPRRSVLMRVLGDQEARPEIDTRTIGTRVGDRWMLCSDGLCGYVPEEIIKRILVTTADAAEATELLVGEALEHGAPDNVTVLVLDMVDEAAAAASEFIATPRFVGSGTHEVVIDDRKGRKSLQIFNRKILDDIIGRGFQDAKFLPGTEEYLEQILRETRSRIRWRRIRQIITVIAVVGLVVAGLVAGYNYTQTRYFVGVKDGYIAIYQGIREELGPFKFNHVVEKTEYPIASLTDYWSAVVTGGTATAESIAEARDSLKLIITASLEAGPTPGADPTPGATSPSPGASPSNGGGH